jgi:hypothetical protein
MTFATCHLSGPRHARSNVTDRVLFFVVVGIVLLSIYLTATAPETTAQEREEMEGDWWG